MRDDLSCGQLSPSETAIILPTNNALQAMAELSDVLLSVGQGLLNYSVRK
jgi:hypothetical protein